MLKKSIKFLDAFTDICLFFQKQNATQENSSSSDRKPSKDSVFPTPTAAKTTVPLAGISDFSNHRQPTLKTDPTSSPPHSTVTRLEYNAASKKILQQVPENTTSSSQITSEADEFTHFGINVAHQLRSMTLEKALLCQVDITKVLSKYKFGSLNSPSSPPSSLLPPVVASIGDINHQFEIPNIKIEIL